MQQGECMKSLWRNTFANKHRMDKVEKQNEVEANLLGALGYFLPPNFEKNKNKTKTN